MRLLQLQSARSFILVDFVGSNTPPYAILSHTWGPSNEEVTYQDLSSNTGQEKKGYDKLIFCGEQAAKDGLQYFWIDTCCIDKSSSAELSEAITSMFRWYRESAKCYVYLSDVFANKRKADDDTFRYTWEPAFCASRWFSRGWTLQELLAPPIVCFFSGEGKQLGDKASLEQQIHEITQIPISALRGAPLCEYDIEERMSWTRNRQTTREEDQAYSLVGIFSISMLPNYGEGKERAFERLQKEIRETLCNQNLLLREDQKQMLLDSLCFDQIDTRQTNIKNAHAKTCRWLLKDSTYLQWLDDDKLREHHGFLWIKGKPGTGKSTLMKYALLNARKTMKDNVLISFFFNARGENIEKSTIGTYRSLLLQLFQQLPALQSVFSSLGLSTSNLNKDYQWNVEVLTTLFEQAIRGLGKSHVVCFIDALDECEEEQVRDMIQFFEHIGELAVANRTRFRVCFSSRHYPHITMRNGLSLVLEGQEGHSQDITDYVETELKIGQSKMAQQIRSKLEEKASGIFMWVVLVVGILNKEHDRGRMHALRQRLEQIPSDLHQLFRDILTRDSHSKNELVLCIQWVLFAREPLSPEQLYFAILSGVEPDAVLAWDREEITGDVIKRFILDSSKGLVEITTTKHQKVQFIHESVRDFLLKEDGFGNIWPDLRSNLVGQSHQQLKCCCLAYMSIDVFSYLEIPKCLPKANSQEATDLRNSATNAFPFLEYAVRNTLYHANAAEGSDIAQGAFCQNFPLKRWIKLDNLFEKHEVRRHTDGMSLWCLLGERNMSNLINARPCNLSCLDVEKERYGPPLFAAMATGSKEAIRAFTEVLIREQPTKSPFRRTNSQYHGDKEGFANVGRDFKFSTRRNIPSYLAELGNEQLLSLVLGLDEDVVDSKDQNGRTPLLWAVRNRHEAVIKMLLDTGKVNVNYKDIAGRTPLSWAAGNGHEVVIKMLLDTGKVDVNYKDMAGRTPLSWAAGNGHEAITKLLLDTGEVDVNSWDRGGGTPLLLAANFGNEAVVKLLLDTGKFNVNSRDQNWRTPLSWASGNGNEAVVKLLLDTGKVDVNYTDAAGRTPLSWAAENGHEAVVKLLLNIDKIDVNSKDYSREMPLSRAAVNGHEAVIKRLLNSGKVDVDVDFTDWVKGTLLLWEAANRHEVVTKLLQTHWQLSSTDKS